MDSLENNSFKKLCGVILAGGAGQRIQPLNLACPKPLLPVCNKPIAEHQVLQMVALGIRDIYIIVGQMHRQIMSHFGDGSKWGVRIHYVVQPSPKGIAHALSMLEPHVQQPMLVFLGDIFFAPKRLSTALEVFYRHKASAVLAVKEEPDPDMIRRNFSVEVGEGGRVYRVIEKPISPPSTLKGCGLYIFQPAIFAAIRQTPPSTLRNECELTDAVQTLIDLGLPVYVADVVDWDMNITYARDLLLCNLRELERTGVGYMLGSNVILPEGTTVRRSVLGDNVIVPARMIIEDSVVFNNVVVDHQADLRQSILLHLDVEISCKDDETDILVLR